MLATIRRRCETEVLKPSLAPIKSAGSEGGGSEPRTVSSHSIFRINAAKHYVFPRLNDSGIKTTGNCQTACIILASSIIVRTLRSASRGNSNGSPVAKDVEASASHAEFRSRRSKIICRTAFPGRSCKDSVLSKSPVLEDTQRR
jgi:hypothetical protein